MTSEVYKTKIESVRKSLLDLHKTLIDLGRADYEDKHGPINQAGKWIQLLISDPFFAWLHPFSNLITTFDELLELEREILELDAKAVRAEVENLIGHYPSTPSDFRNRYLDILQRHPDVVIMHSKIKKDLDHLPVPEEDKLEELLQHRSNWKNITIKINPGKKRLN